MNTEEISLSGFNSNSTPEFRKKTVRSIMENDKPAMGAVEEPGIDKNTVCPWVRACRCANKPPSYKKEIDIYIRGKTLKIKKDKRRMVELEGEVEMLRDRFFAIRIE